MSSPKKIGIVTEYFYPHLGGITEHVYFFSLEMARRGFEVVILTGYRGEEAEVDLPPNLRVVHVGKTVPMFSNGSFGKVTIGWNLGRRVREILAEEKFDLLHIHSPSYPVLPILFHQNSDTVTVGTLHTYFDSLLIYDLLYRFIVPYYNTLDGLIAVSPACIEALKCTLTVDHKIIPNGVSTDWFAHPRGKITPYDDGAKNILFLGRLDPRNGLESLLKAVPMVLNQVPEARLLVVGDGPLRSVYEQKAGALLGKKIFFEGQINGNRPEYFATSDLFCYPATKSSFGITLLEAMAAGRPVVASDSRGFKDVIEDGVTGLLARQENPQDLADRLIQVLKDDSLRDRLVENGRRKAEEYAWSRVTDQVLEFYNQIYFKKRGILFAP